MTSFVSPTRKFLIFPFTYRLVDLTLFKSLIEVQKISGQSQILICQTLIAILVSREKVAHVITCLLVRMYILPTVR